MMKAGTYWIGDLCYVLDSQWDQVCDIIIKDGVCIDGEFELEDGTKFAMQGTAHGDGSYFDLEGREYWVDSGSIGCVLAEGVESHDGGNVIKFDIDFTVDNDNGKIRFLDESGILLLSIDTDPEDDYLDYDDDFLSDEI